MQRKKRETKPRRKKTKPNASFTPTQKSKWIIKFSHSINPWLFDKSISIINNIRCPIWLYTHTYILPDYSSLETSCHTGKKGVTLYHTHRASYHWNSSVHALSWYTWNIIMHPHINLASNTRITAANPKAVNKALPTNYSTINHLNMFDQEKLNRSRRRSIMISKNQSKTIYTWVKPDWTLGFLLLIRWVIIFKQNAIALSGSSSLCKKGIKRRK